MKSEFFRILVIGVHLHGSYGYQASRGFDTWLFPKIHPSWVDLAFCFFLFFFFFFFSSDVTARRVLHQKQNWTDSSWRLSRGDGHKKIGL
jgi:hypothetical protein